MIEVVEAFDRAPVAKHETDDSAALDRKIGTAGRAWRQRER